MQKELTLEEAARIAHVSVETIRYWIKTGRLEALPGPISARSGRPYGKRVTREGLMLANPREKIDHLKKQHADLALYTIPELAKQLNCRHERVYQLIRKFQLKKYMVDNWTYMVSGVELYEKAMDDQYYAQLFLHL